MKFHVKISEIENNESLDADSKAREIEAAIDDFYDYMAMDELLEAREAMKSE